MPRPLRIPDDERRARLVVRHHLGRTARDVVEVVHGVTALHSTDPATPFLSAWARTPGFEISHLGQALIEDRSLWRLHAMRRTLFIVPTAGAASFLEGVAREVFRRERRRLEVWLAAEIGAPAVEEFVADLEARVLETLSNGGEWRTQELSAAIPELGTQVTLGSGKWTTRSPVSSRLLFLMAMDGKIVRTRAAGSWRSSQYRWASADQWFSGPPDVIEPEAARAEVVRRYLAKHGPATLDDIRWWTGWTVRQVKSALARLEPVAATLGDGSEGLLLPGDTEPVAGDVRHVSLLPALDSTPMGWKGREWFLGAHADALFDRNGNIGPTIWVDGRIVGGWGQRPGGEVVFRLLEPVDPATGARIATETANLREWLGGTTVVPRFRTPLEKELSTTEPP
jgi:hypothetical protein